jgi:NTE family protein
VAVDTASGARRVFDRDSGISALDAAMASGAVAGIRPPVRFMDRLYMDGGFYSITNADLAADYERILILTLRSGIPPLSVVSLETELQILKAHKRAVEVVYPDEEAERAFSCGKSWFDPAIRNPSVIAGRAQGCGRSLRDRVNALWS